MGMHREVLAQLDATAREEAKYLTIQVSMLLHLSEAMGNPLISQYLFF